MATATNGSASIATADVATYSTISFTPAVNDLLVEFVGLTGQTDTDWTVTDSLGGTWTKILRAVKNTSADIMECWVRTTLSDGTALSTTYSHAVGNATGAAWQVVRISGMTRTGASAVRQTAQQDDQAAGTPAPTFASACLTDNVTLGRIHNATNPATMTVPTGWSEGQDGGYNLPTTGAETVWRNSGFTGTTITWGSASATDFSAMIIELDTSALTEVPTPIPRIGPDRRTGN